MPDEQEKATKTGGASRSKSSIGRLAKLSKGGGRLYLLGIVKGLLDDADLVERHIARLAPRAVALTVNPAEVRSLKTIFKSRPRGYDLKVSKDVQELGRMMWSWECSCGNANPPDMARCPKCKETRPGEGEGISGRMGSDGSTGHGAADNIWAETGTPSWAADQGEDRPFCIGDIISYHDELYMTLLSGLGAVRFPSPAFLAAFRDSRSGGSSPHGIDMDEEQFTELHLKEVGYLDLLRSGRALKRIEGRVLSPPPRKSSPWSGTGGPPGSKATRTRRVTGSNSWQRDWIHWSPRE
jgi:hypothetical protein